MTSYEKKNINNIINDENKNFEEKMTLISEKVYIDAKKKNIKKDENRQEFISTKIVEYISNKVIINNNIKFVDIGGGNGNVLHGISNIMKMRGLQFEKTNMICVETKNDWVESYAFNNEDVTYKFWDNNVIEIEDNSIDIVMCMVSLHHMTDDIIDNTLNEIKRIIKKGGYLFIKEHDANNKDTIKYIEWEHNLYHIMDCWYENKCVNVDEYMEKNIANFKSKDEWLNLIEEKNMKFIERTDRMLSGCYNNNYDDKNVTNLYWDVYKS